MAAWVGWLAAPVLAAPAQRVPAPVDPVAGRTVLTGTVLDSSGAPVPNALVRVETLTGQSAPVETATDGRFVLSDVATGRATLLVLAPGFAEVTMPVLVTADLPALDIVLQPARLPRP